MGEFADDVRDRLRDALHSFRLPIDPPKRGGERPGDWRERVDETAETVARSP